MMLVDSVATQYEYHYVKAEVDINADTGIEAGFKQTSGTWVVYYPYAG